MCVTALKRGAAMREFVAKDHVIHSRGGQLVKESNGPADVGRIVRQALTDAAGGLVIHFHGGLVGEKAARKSAAGPLHRTYAQKGGAYPIFFVWESGFLEAPWNNRGELARELTKILDEDFFRAVLKKVAKWALRQLPAGPGVKGAGSGVSTGELAAEFDAFFERRRPTPPDALATLASAGVMPGLRATAPEVDELAAQIEEDLETDAAFGATVEAVANGLVSQPRATLKGSQVRISAKSRITKEAAANLFGKRAGAGAAAATLRGTWTWLDIAKVLAKIVIRVLRRMRAGRGHGPYVTLVEEVLRELYVDKIGRYGWWDRMKGDTADAFKPGLEHAGTALLTELGKQIKPGPTQPRITLVGHSTGAIYICNLLRAAAVHVPALQFDVIFEAPAVTYAFLAKTIAEHGSRIRNFRQFSMNDTREADDVLVPVLYVSSLLYFISGLLEHDPDEPLVGMERYLTRKDIYTSAAFPNVQVCRDFFEKYRDSLVWSPRLDNRPGLSSDGQAHGEFDDVDQPTMDSVAHILARGF